MRDLTSLFMNIKGFVKPILFGPTSLGALLNTNNIFRSDVKSRFQAGPFDIIYYF